MNEIGGEMVRHYCPPLTRLKVEKLQKNTPGNHSGGCHLRRWMKKGKGLCFWCDEKLGVGHRCKNRQLFRLEVYAEDEDEELEVAAEEEKEVAQGNLAHIS